MTHSSRPASGDLTRLFAGVADLEILTRFASRCLAQYFPIESAWHPGDIVWEYFTDGINAPRDPKRDIRFWFRDGEAVAVAWWYGADDLCYELLPSVSDTALLDDVVAWGETVTKANPFGVRAYDKNIERTRRLAELGFRRTNRGGVAFRRSLALQIEDAPLPDGYSIRDCVDIDIEARVDCHRDAWSHLEEIGITAARSSFSRERYMNVVSLAAYDPKLDIAIEAPDGRLVASCTCWADSESQLGTYEPVGTVAGFRRKGLARAAILEGARRLQSAGMKWARVGTNLINVPAVNLYRSAGFDTVDEQHLWVKGL